jgi:hypothetical protein
MRPYTLSYLDRLTGVVTQAFRQQWPFWRHHRAPHRLCPSDRAAGVRPVPSGGIDASAAGIRETLFVPFAVAPDGSASVEFGADNYIQIRDHALDAARCAIVLRTSPTFAILAPSPSSLESPSDRPMDRPRWYPCSSTAVPTPAATPGSPPRSAARWRCPARTRTASAASTHHHRGC